MVDLHEKLDSGAVQVGGKMLSILTALGLLLGFIFVLGTPIGTPVFKAGVMILFFSSVLLLVARRWKRGDESQESNMGIIVFSSCLFVLGAVFGIAKVIHGDYFGALMSFVPMLIGGYYLNHSYGRNRSKG